MGPEPPFERWVRTGSWKLVDYEEGEDALFHLMSDPDEQYNLIDAPMLRFIQSLLRRQLEEWWS